MVIEYNLSAKKLFLLIKNSGWGPSPTPSTGLSPADTSVPDYLGYNWLLDLRFYKGVSFNVVRAGGLVRAVGWAWTGGFGSR